MLGAQVDSYSESITGIRDKTTMEILINFPLKMWKDRTRLMRLKKRQKLLESEACKDVLDRRASDICEKRVSRQFVSACLLNKCERLKLQTLAKLFVESRTSLSENCARACCKPGAASADFLSLSKCTDSTDSSAHS